MKERSADGGIDCFSNNQHHSMMWMMKELLFLFFFVFDRYPSCPPSPPHTMCVGGVKGGY